MYDPVAAAEVGYLDKAVAIDALMDSAMATARNMLELDGEAFASTKQRMRQPTVDRIRKSMAA